MVVNVFQNQKPRGARPSPSEPKGIVLGPVKASTNKARHPLREDEPHPPSHAAGGQPDPRDLRWCAWGFLMAAKLFEQGEPPSLEYLEVLAEMNNLRVPAMSTVWPDHQSGLRGPDGELIKQKARE